MSWRFSWHPTDLATEAEMLARGVSYLACEIGGVRHFAPLGSEHPPGVPVETVYADGARKPGDA